MNKSKNKNNATNNNKILVALPLYTKIHEIENTIQNMLAQTFNNILILIIYKNIPQHLMPAFNKFKRKYCNNTILFLECESNYNNAKIINLAIDYLNNDDTFTHFTWLPECFEYYPDFLTNLIKNNTFFNHSSFHITDRQMDNNIHILKHNYKDSRQILNNWKGCYSFMWSKQAINEIGRYNELCDDSFDKEYLMRTFQMRQRECLFTNIPLLKYTGKDYIQYILKKENKKTQMQEEVQEIVNAQAQEIVNAQAQEIVNAQAQEIVNAQAQENSKPFIKIVTSPIIITCAIMLQNALKTLGLSSEVIFDITTNYSDDYFYIILFTPSMFIPKNFIFWQIEQTSNVESTNIKFDAHCYNKLNKCVSIFEISPNNISHYKPYIKDTECKKIRYNQLPFSNIYNLNTAIIDEYDYDIVFYGASSSRREKITNKLQSTLGSKYRMRFLFGVSPEERDTILKKTKLLLNIHYYESAMLECERFNIAINCNCLILSENCIGDNQNKKNYECFDKLLIDNATSDISELTIKPIVDLIEYNLRDSVFFLKKQKYIEEKKKLEDIGIYYLHKNLLSLNIFNSLDLNIDFKITDSVYCLSLIEDDSRYTKMMTQNNVPKHSIFPAFKHTNGKVGCAMSYCTLLNNCKKQNVESITIFEDDVAFNDTFNARHSIVKEFLNKIEWDLFNGYCCFIDSYIDIEEYYIYKGVVIIKLHKSVGMVFNIYNKSIFNDESLNCNNYYNKLSLVNQIDQQLQTTRNRTFICYPQLVNILDVESSIQPYVYGWYKNVEQTTNQLIEQFIKNNKPKEII
jgi:hypothetical protein